ncbi:MAG: DNA-directed RNA polymerase subunit alpha [bacterium]|nr:DNA-directed RNA polymerase subunit alpha [bacterium]
MRENDIILPSRPRIILEEDTKGVYEIDGLYAGYGNTVGNSLRRVILSSLPGAAITTVKIEGINHEFSTIPGMKEDVVILVLNLKQVRFKLIGDEPQKATIAIKGAKVVCAGDFKVPSQLEVLNKDKVIATLTDKNSELKMEITVEKGLGYVPREVLKKEKVEAGTLMLDAIFTPIRRVNYEVENMRVGERTDYNRLRFIIETDGSIMPREALENAIKILINQLHAIVGFETEKEEETLEESAMSEEEMSMIDDSKKNKGLEEDFLKTRIEDLNFSGRTANALSKAGIRTVGGLSKKREEDLLKIEGLGKKAIAEIRRVLGGFGIILK